MAFNPSYALANEICSGLAGLLELSNSNDASDYAAIICALLSGQAARHNSIETVRANSANTMDHGHHAGIVHQV